MPTEEEEEEKVNINTELDMVFAEPVKNTKNHFTSTRT